MAEVLGTRLPPTLTSAVPGRQGAETPPLTPFQNAPERDVPVGMPRTLSPYLSGPVPPPTLTECACGPATQPQHPLGLMRTPPSTTAALDDILIQ